MSNYHRHNTIFLFILLCIVSCRDKNEQRDKIPVLKKNSQEYARRFVIDKRPEAVLVHLFGNRDDPQDTTASFVLIKDAAEKTVFPQHYKVIRIPCKKIAALSSIYASMLTELGAIDAIAAIDNMDYVIDMQIREKHKITPIKELAKSPQIDLEKTAALDPDIVFTYGMGHGEELSEKLISTKIPIAVSVDHLEESPLARAEWIKFFAAFVDKEREADSIFDRVKSNYVRLSRLADSVSEHPTVFSELKFGDVWYMPGGRSYVAQLLKDAGANYLWSDDEKSGSLALSFEQVYARAANAEFWINLSMVTTKKELLGHEPRYAEFKAFKKGNLYNNNLVTNEKGYSIYWETGMFHPDRILSDLFRIFHPGAQGGLENHLYYYRQIK